VLACFMQSISRDEQTLARPVCGVGGGLVADDAQNRCPDPAPGGRDQQRPLPCFSALPFLRLGPSHCPRDPPSRFARVLAAALRPRACVLGPTPVAGPGVRSPRGPEPTEKFSGPCHAAFSSLSLAACRPSRLVACRPCHVASSLLAACRLPAQHPPRSPARRRVASLPTESPKNGDRPERLPPSAPRTLPGRATPTGDFRVKRPPDSRSRPRGEAGRFPDCGTRVGAAARPVRSSLAVGGARGAARAPPLGQPSRQARPTDATWACWVSRSNRIVTSCSQWPCSRSPWAGPPHLPSRHAASSRASARLSLRSPRSCGRQQPLPSGAISRFQFSQGASRSESQIQVVATNHAKYASSSGGSRSCPCLVPAEMNDHRRAASPWALVLFMRCLLYGASRLQS